MQDLTGHKLGHYLIVEQIGAGGMGMVFRAHDELLDRDVAIKVLPEEVACDPDRLARFDREARAVARLSHPNILAIHELGNHEDRPFLVTELLEGESLREVIDDRRLSPRKIIDYASQIARGLSAAHDREIVHRDLKPGNIFVTTDGVVKILDFGLAKLKHREHEVDEGTEARTLTQETDPGTVMGTVGYMSPEQVRAEATDSRSDIFSLGVVLYEMLSGQRPFKAASSAEIMTAIARENPPRLSDLEPGIEPPLERIVGRCLEKRPENRFQSARDLAFDLQGILSDSEVRSTPTITAAQGRPRTALLIAAAVVAVALGALTVALMQRNNDSIDATLAVQPERTLVAVLPFENLTGNSALDPLGTTAAQRIGDGLAETETAEVVPAMVVRDTMQAMAGQSDATGTLLVLAETTGAGTVVSGSYSFVGEVLHFRATLTDASNQKLIHSLEDAQGFDETATDPIDRLRTRVMAAVTAHLSWDANLRATTRPPTWEAYREYVAAMDLMNLDGDKAISHLQRSIELDPDFVAPRLRLFGAHWNVGEYATADGVLEPVRKARAGLTPLGRHRLGVYEALIQGNYHEGLRLYREAHRLDPEDPSITIQIAHYARKINRPLEMLSALEKVDPAQYSSMNYWSFLCQAHHMLGDYEAELAAARRGQVHFPQLMRMREWEASALAALGRVDEVRRVIDQSTALTTMKGRSRFSEPAGKVMLTAAAELRAHGFHEAAAPVEDRAVEWYRDLARESGEQARYRRGLAGALYQARRWVAAKSIFEEIAAHSIDRVDNIEDERLADALGHLGVLAARTGDEASATKISSDLSRITGYYLGWNHYWRACIAAHLGSHEEAVELLNRARSEGVEFYVSFHRDIGLEPLWDYPPFHEFLRPKG